MRAQKNNSASSSRRQRGYVVWLILVGMVCVVFASWQYSSFRKSQKLQAATTEENRRLEIAKKADEQRRSNEEAELKKRQAEAQAKNDALTIADRALDDVLVRWQDASKVASTTGRIALSTPVSNLQTIRRDAERLTVSPCMDSAKAMLVTSMASTIEGYLFFMQNTAQLGDMMATPSFARAGREMEGFVEGRKNCPH
jgi:hypothetical protein